MHNLLKKIYQLSGRDISAYADSFLEKTIRKRIIETSSLNEVVYAELLESEPVEVQALLDSLNISYSQFFRNPLDFSIIERFILPSLYHRKGLMHSTSIRIWSAGCADGPEPYSLAIIGDELMQRLLLEHPPLIFATDISRVALDKAGIGQYYSSALQNVRHSQLDCYFTRNEMQYQVADHLKKHIEFSLYDLLDTKTSSPPSAIFGGFDMVVCCNLLVYYKREIQERIIKKIHHSLSDKGFLMVDQAEKSIVKSIKGFRLYSALGNIFVKN